MEKKSSSTHKMNAFLMFFHPSHVLDPFPAVAARLSMERAEALSAIDETTAEMRRTILG
jgi:hypothetical protein